MTLKILDDSMSSDRSPHTARLAPGEQHAWEVSWLPGRRLNRNEAVTAMELADTTVNGHVHPGHQAWPHIQGWAAHLGMTGSQALDRVAGPPRWADHQEKPAVLAHIEGGDPFDLGWDDVDWFLPDWSDDSWRGPRRPTTYRFTLAVSPWYKEHYPDKSANLWDALHAGRDPQPDHEPDKSADWEAGQ
jgi:hypothetical protein